jgi:exonuclease III
MFLKKHIFCFIVFCSYFLNAQTNIKAMFYNTLNYNSDIASESRTPYLKTILDAVQPDLFMICELKNEAASNYLFENAVLPSNANFNKAEFKPSQSPAKSLLQMVYYNTEKLELEYNEVIPTNIRDINHYTFKVKTDNSEETPVRIEVFVTHLKASRGSENMDKRLASVENFTRELERLPENSNVLFAGDFNFYTSNEAGFQEIIDETNAIQLIDPIDRLCPTFPENGVNYFIEDNYDATYFWNNPSFADVHSQSARNGQVNGDGSGGGMDDRFDFIMMSKNLQTSDKLAYVENSYKTVGNNSNCYNSFVSNSTCTGEFSQNLRNALYYFSDHLPIVMELESPRSTLSTTKFDSFSIIISNLVTNTLVLQTPKLAKNIAVYNQLGQKVFEVKNLDTTKIEIETSTFTQGLYYIKIDNYKTQKFIKL